MPPPHHQGFVQQGPTAQHHYQAHTGEEYLMRVEDAPDAVAMCLRPLRNR